MVKLFRFWRRRLPAASQGCPLCDSTLLRQARQLIEAGYHVGAVASARCDLESRVKAAASSVNAIVGGDYAPTWHWHATAMFLKRHGLLTIREARRVSAAMARASGMVHDAGKCNCLKARWIVTEVEAIAGILQAALRRGLESSAA